MLSAFTGDRTARYNLLLALFPVLGLVKAHTSPFYVLDGTVGLLLLLFFSFVFIRIRRPKVQLFYGVASVVLIYGLAGSVGGALRSGGGFHEPLVPEGEMVRSFAVFLIGVLLTYIGIRLATGIPLTDGIYSERYQESQLQPTLMSILSGFVLSSCFLTLLVAASR